MKYIIFKFIGAELPVIFPGDIFNHDNIKVVSEKFGDGKAISAGKCEITPDGDVRAWGDSFSLGLKSRKKDADLIKRGLRDNRD